MSSFLCIKLSIYRMFCISVFLISCVNCDSDAEDTSTAAVFTTPNKLSLPTAPDSQTRANVVKEDPKLDVGPLMEITVARGETTRLPCIHDNLAKDNKVRLVLWYRNDTTRPFISYDARLSKNESDNSQVVSKSVHHDEESRRTAMRNSLENEGQTLMIIEVVDSDQAEYRCTVHYSTSPSVTRRLKLIVVDSVQRVQLLDVDSRPVGAHVGPFSEESQLTITCKAHFSCQIVDIQWQMEGKPMASKWNQPEEGMAMSSLKLNLNYNHSLDTLTCRLICNTTREGNIEASIVDASTTIIMYYLPKATIYAGSAGPIVKSDLKDADNVFHRVAEGKPLTLICEVKARPPAYNISWLHNGKVITLDSRRSVKANTSLVISRVAKEDAGLYTCIASNSEGDGQSNAINIKVDYTPYCIGEKQRRVVATRNKSVTLDCRFAAEPLAMNVSWTFDPPIPTPKPTAKYSPKLQIYTPNPVDEEFSPEEIMSKLPKIQFKLDQDNPAVSYLTFVPTNGDHDVVCYAKNSIGKTVAPCSFKLQVVEPPDAPSNCEVSVLPDSKLKVSCDSKHIHQLLNSSEPSSPGISYVLSPEARTSSHLEVWSENELVSNLTNERPLWVVRGLPPESKIGLRLYTASQHARSSYVELEARTTRRALSTSSDEPSDPDDTEFGDHSENEANSATGGDVKTILVLIGCLIAGIFLLLTMVLAALFFIRRRSRRGPSQYLAEDGNSTPGTTVLEIIGDLTEPSAGDTSKTEDSATTA